METKAAPRPDLTVSGAVKSIYPPVVWLALFAGLVVWSYELDETSRAAPLLTGYAGLVLGMLDFLARLDLSVSRVIRDSLGAGFSNPEIAHNPSMGAEMIQFSWMTFFVLMVLFVGVLPAVPVYVLMSMRLNGRRSWKESLVACLSTLAFVYVVFEIFLAFELYRGVMFDERGFDRW